MGQGLVKYMNTYRLDVTESAGLKFMLKQCAIYFGFEEGDLAADGLRPDQRQQRRRRSARRSRPRAGRGSRPREESRRMTHTSGSPSLGVAGFAFADLFEPTRLGDLLQAFDGWLLASSRSCSRRSRRTVAITKPSATSPAATRW